MSFALYIHCFASVLLAWGVAHYFLPYCPLSVVIHDLFIVLLMLYGSLFKKKKRKEFLLKKISMASFFKNIRLALLYAVHIKHCSVQKRRVHSLKMSQFAMIILDLVLNIKVRSYIELLLKSFDSFILLIFYASKQGIF